MILSRLGNKKKLASALIKHFPTHLVRIELFVGAGSSFFYTNVVQNAILNDLDNDVYNLYMVVKNQKNELIEAIKSLVIHQTLVDYWRVNHENDNLYKAVRFLLLSNFTLYSKARNLRFGYSNPREMILKNISEMSHRLKNVVLMCEDFRNVIPKISFSTEGFSKNDAFVYLDPCYLDTKYNYKVPKWSKSDTIDCFKLMKNCKIKCALSEFKSQVIMDLALSYGFNVILLKERRNIHNRKTEVLITNYNKELLLFQ